MAAPRLWALIPAAGQGRRMRTAPSRPEPKQYLPLAGRRMIEHSVGLFVNHVRIAGLVVVVPPDDRLWPTLTIASSPRIHCVPGGEARQTSVLAGLAHLRTLADEKDWVLVHDAARPCLTRALLDLLIETLERDEVGGLLALPAQDTIKQASDGRVSSTLDRGVLWQAQTPQMFRVGLLQQALQAAAEAGRVVTDEAQAIELAGHRPRLVESNPENLKVTRPEELAYAEFVLQQRQRGRHA